MSKPCTRWEEEDVIFSFKTGVSYKKALPPDKWDNIMRFLVLFNRYGKIADGAGLKLNVGKFIRTYINAGVGDGK